ncbi:uncharacterized protein LOC119884331 isoform X3 [Micropterus salmoides]|uniref:uncharacterized protein LOC119884331 isoform X3 n=1 Tax=Micropterus salmoides TaxID=27706 RepID=UPI0018ED990B|nr:uncharacterized protein LOC119884331 isoform X3 [Micropterus salmoides]
MEHLQNLKIMIKVMVIVLHCRDSSADMTRKLSVLVGTDVTLSCLFDKLSKLAEWSTLTIEWNMLDRHAEKSIVYTFEDGKAHGNRDGSVVDTMRLLESDASLQLRNVTVGDEGLYTCRIITPVVYIETTSLEVLARPSLLLPEKAAVTEGEEKTIQCDITGFYPEKLAVTWHIQNGSHTVPAGASHLFRVCTEMAIHNPDDTYSIRSGITVHSSAVRDGEMCIICQVEHQTYTQPYNRSVKLTVQAPAQPLYSAVTLISVTSVISLLLVTLVIGSTLLLYRYFFEAPPSVSEISQPSIIYAQVPSDLKCTIHGASQRELKVKWLRLRSRADSAVQSESVSLLVSEDLSEQACLQSDDRHHTSVLTVCLTVAEDLTKYRCVVLCRGKSFSRETTVQWSRLSSRSPVSLRSPRWRSCWFSAVGWRTSTPSTWTWSGPGTTESRSTPSQTSDPSLTTTVCTACGVKFSLLWPERTRGPSTPAVFTTPASLHWATKMSCTTSTLKELLLM